MTSSQTPAWRRLWQPRRGVFWLMLAFNLLSSLMAWTSAGAHARMDEVARGVLSTLRSEMASAHRVLPATPSPRPIGIGVEAC